MSISQSIASCLKPYLTITGFVPGKTYSYREESDRRVVNCTMHRPKYCLHPIVYMAVRAGADVKHLQPGDKLYVGSQSGPDRMFRGDGLAKELNFHHAQMRDGRNNNGMERYLEEGGRVKIYLAEGPDLREFTKSTPTLENLSRLLAGEVSLTHPVQIKRRDHVGYWVEQLILRDEHSQWAWNTHGVEGPAADAFRVAGI